MAEGESPTVARRRVRLALREAREAARFTQMQVAETMEWSLSKVIRIENGDVSITPNDLRPLLAHLGVRNQSVVASLLHSARIARIRQRQAWHQEPEYRGYFSEALRLIIEYEADAPEVRFYSAHFIPDPLQTTAYRDALLDLPDGDTVPEGLDRDVYKKTRSLRREALLSRTPDLQISVLLDEAALRRPTGGLDVFSGQLTDLYELALARRIDVRMIEFSNDATLFAKSTFELVSLDDDGFYPTVLFAGDGSSDELVENPEITSRSLEHFNNVWRSATNESDTIEFIRGRIEHLAATARYRRASSHDQPIQPQSAHDA